MASGFFSGNDGDLKVYHTVNAKNEDIVGPSNWDVISTATFQTAKAKFGKALLCDATNEALRSAVDIPALDDSDTGKTVFFCHWEPDDLSFVRNQIFITGPAFSGERARLAFDTFGGGTILMRWVRKTDISPGLNAIDVRSNGGKISINNPFTLVGYVNHNSSSEGKIFINGIDETASVTEVARPAVVVSTKRVVFGNSQTGLAPCGILDEPCIIQGSNLNNTKVADLVAKYETDPSGFFTRGLGYRPTFTSLVAA